ncbi:MAG: hypothetical protein FWG66_02205 [Spirochaetes bacterium]|nr:hypothetical protein [Spirochaetota bacterium]
MYAAAFAVKNEKAGRLKPALNFLLILFLITVYWLGLFSLMQTLDGWGDPWGAFFFLWAYMAPSAFITIVYIVVVIVATLKSRRRTTNA